ncbi:MAG: hypothetical protein HOV78_18725 [Hamadaea sp.]|nr:hypothetical protein [Hamadaea sp.]
MRTRIWGIVLVPLLLAIAGCTDDGRPSVASAGTATATPAPSSTLSHYDQVVAYTMCMRQHGVPMDDPIGTGDDADEGHIQPGFDKGKADAAVAACQSLRPPRVGPDVDLKTELSRRYARCMREHGVEQYPDPDAQGQTRVPQQVGEDPEYPAAKNVCDQLTEQWYASAAATLRPSS